MNNRTRVSLISALVILSISTSVEAAGRGGGVRAGGARAATFHAGPHFAVRHRPFIAPVHRQGRVHSVLSPHRFGLHHRRGINRQAGDAVIGGGIVLGPSYDSSGMGFGPYPPAPVAPDPILAQPEDSLAAAGMVCRTTVQIVPRERGGQAQVRVTRCYPPGQ